jgi:hypothetical protein
MKTKLDDQSEAMARALMDRIESDGAVHLSSMVDVIRKELAVAGHSEESPAQYRRVVIGDPREPVLGPSQYEWKQKGSAIGVPESMLTAEEMIADLERLRRDGERKLRERGLIQQQNSLLGHLQKPTGECHSTPAPKISLTDD